MFKTRGSTVSGQFLLLSSKHKSTFNLASELAKSESLLEAVIHRHCRKFENHFFTLSLFRWPSLTISPSFMIFSGLRTIEDVRRDSTYYLKVDPNEIAQRESKALGHKPHQISWILWTHAWMLEYVTLFEAFQAVNCLNCCIAQQPSKLHRACCSLPVFRNTRYQ